MFFIHGFFLPYNEISMRSHICQQLIHDCSFIYSSIFLCIRCLSRCSDSFRHQSDLLHCRSIFLDLFQFQSISRLHATQKYLSLYSSIFPYLYWNLYFECDSEWCNYYSKPSIYHGYSWSYRSKSMCCICYSHRNGQCSFQFDCHEKGCIWQPRYNNRQQFDFCGNF